MQFTILGTGSGLPVLGKGQAAILTEVKDKQILFDCGEGTTYKLLELEMQPNDLDVIVISHMHPDHASGLPMLIQMLYLQGRTKTLTLYVPEDRKRTMRLLNDFYLFEDKFDFNLIISDIQELRKSSLGVKPILNAHLEGYKDIVRKYKLDNELKSYSFVINDKDNVMVYTSDIQDLDHLKEELEKVDCIIVDAIHVSLSKIEMLFNLGIKRIILNHGISDEIQSFINESKINGVEIAEEGKVITC